MMTKSLKNHELWLQNNGGERANLKLAHLEGAHLEGAHLEGAHLERAHLEGAHLDFSSWPLWCGSVGAIVDRKISVQLLAHWWYAKCDDPDVIELKNDPDIIKTLQSFHRITECGEICEQ